MPMHVIQPFSVKQVHMGRIAFGADIIESLEVFCRERDIQHAWVNCLGALSQVTLAYHDQKARQYVNRDFRGDLEILNGTGNITLKDGEHFAHIHLTLGTPEFLCVGGHLIKGSTQIFVCEFALFELDGEVPLIRCPDEKTGLAMW
jgi:predicted DNA-binding protein with PD1-like motif